MKKRSNLTSGEASSKEVIEKLTGKEMRELNEDFQDHEIVDYEVFVCEDDVNKIDAFFTNVDSYKVEIIEAVLAVLNLEKEKHIGRLKLLQMLNSIQTKLKRRINTLKMEIPEAASANLWVRGTLKEGCSVHIPEWNSLVQRKKKENLKKYQKDLKDHLYLILGILLEDLEDTIYNLEMHERYPDINDWNPQKAYGPHQENEKWVAETYKKVREQLPSNNQADEKVIELYKDKFGLIISDRTIQRFTDR